MIYDIDSKFRDYFKNIKQIFLYITNECDLRCKQCLYKPSLTFHLNKKEIEFNEAINLLNTFFSLGAKKLTLIGGEPTLYKKIPDLIYEAKQIGFDYIRLDTNGQFKENLLLDDKFKYLNEIAYSLDGFTKGINDELRGNGTYDKCISNIKKSVLLNYNTSITCCIHKNLIKKSKNGEYLLNEMIRFAENLKVNTINFHDLFKVGVPMDVWSGKYNISIKEWIKIYKNINDKILSNKYKISVRLPQSFITKDEFLKNPEYYGYCPVKLGERIMIHPNGILRICSNLICTSYIIGKYLNNKIIWENSSSNEILDHKLNELTPCTNRNKINYGEYVPLCFSFKPNQNEFIWKGLKWDLKRKINNS